MTHRQRLKLLFDKRGLLDGFAGDTAAPAVFPAGGETLGDVAQQVVYHAGLLAKAVHGRNAHCLDLASLLLGLGGLLCPALLFLGVLARLVFLNGNLKAAGWDAVRVCVCVLVFIYFFLFVC